MEGVRSSQNSNSPQAAGEENPSLSDVAEDVTSTRKGEPGESWATAAPADAGPSREQETMDDAAQETDSRQHDDPPLKEEDSGAALKIAAEPEAVADLLEKLVSLYGTVRDDRSTRKSTTHELAESARQRSVVEAEAETLRPLLSERYGKIPNDLQASPQLQLSCLNYLAEAESFLAEPKSKTDLIQARRMLTLVDLELARARTRRFSTPLVSLIVYLMVGLGALAYKADYAAMSALELNELTFGGIPVPVILWSVIGSLTSMLLRAGRAPFADVSEALRWVISRPIVGVVMGILTYLLLVAGLLVFAGQAEPQTPQLLWVIAFVGSFSDTLSVNLLQKVLGQFEPIDRGSEVNTVPGGHESQAVPVSAPRPSDDPPPKKTA